MIEGTNNNLKKAKIGNRDFFAFFSSSRKRDKNIEISMFFEEVYMRLSVSAGVEEYKLLKRYGYDKI